MDVSFGSGGNIRLSATGKATLPDKIPNLSRRGHKVAWVAKKLRCLTVLEDAYPNIVTVDQIVK